MFKMTGLKEFQSKLDSLSRKAKRLDGQHQIPIAELLTNSFVSKHTSFASLDELFEASGFKIESREDIVAIPDGKWDAFICKNSGFADWASMLESASEKWVVKQLGL